jgi:hypothetical protein
MCRTRVGAVLAIAGLVATRGLGAQKFEERMEKATAVTCLFTAQAVGNWTGGSAKADTRSPKLTVQFTDVSTDEGSAKAVGEFGSSDILVRYSSGTLHFLQSFRTGPLYVTSIFNREVTPGGGRLLAVHTRHEYTVVALPGFTSRPEQYYGECEVK